MLRVPQVLDKQKPGKREGARSHRYPTIESGNPDDPGWESEVRAREEELSKYEGSILAREFKERLAYNMGQVLPPESLLAWHFAPARAPRPTLTTWPAPLWSGVPRCILLEG